MEGGGGGGENGEEKVGANLSFRLSPAVTAMGSPGILQIAKRAIDAI